ncbi:MAG: MBL fold metallo-hydrolase [bacterium]|nr:MBL fold metallo-hydrolase [bacterium]
MPTRDVDHYIADAEAQGLKIRHVFLTHFHADFVAGHLELRDRVGAEIHLGASATTQYAATGMHDNDVLAFGNVRLVTLETPGHTPESMCILSYDLEQSDSTPQAVLTGGTLFIGDVGRPDLGASIGWTADDLASLLYDSLHTKLLPNVPDEAPSYFSYDAEMNTRERPTLEQSLGEGLVALSLMETLARRDAGAQTARHT